VQINHFFNNVDEVCNRSNLVTIVERSGQKIFVNALQPEKTLNIGWISPESIPHS
jgi:hypothetical protein